MAKRDVKITTTTAEQVRVTRTRKPQTVDAAIETVETVAPVRKRLYIEASPDDQPTVPVEEESTVTFDNPPETVVEAITTTIHNHVCEEYTGHSRAEAVGRSIEAYFKYRGEKERTEAVVTIVASVIEAQQKLNLILEQTLNMLK